MSSIAEIAHWDAERRQDALKAFVESHIDGFLDTFLPLYLAPMQYAGLIETAIRKLVSYNVIGGKMIRGILAADVFCQAIRHLYPGLLEDTEKNGMICEVALLLCFIQEILQASFLIVDDILDDSAVRRGKPAWRRVVGDGQTINDTLHLLTIVDTMMLYLEERCGKTLKLLDVLTKVKACTLQGQHLDAFPNQKEDIFTREYLKEVYTYKTAYYTFYGPILMGYRAAVLLGSQLIFGGTTDGKALPRTPSILELVQSLDPALEEAIRSISLELGQLFQMQDDYLDLYHPELLHKDSGDYREHKATWVVVRALELARNSGETQEEANELLSEIRLAYGRKNSDKEAIKGLFEKVGLRDVYTSEATATYKRCVESMKALPEYITDCLTNVLEHMKAHCTL
ncbi:Farnesyl diphosphate synthase [Giardia muris]|uniref:Farnesyl diphosphate synthase n=1 Tax=Giardia muris TaxID=5742 RepID=A0A4Z1SQG4_GIAMU|nr:Farnesyl diphosphate synthase [Giardia muris]|eukprot:TNJ27155.1 Farnesyl diphosphate synthase [Giardia muris]